MQKVLKNGNQDHQQYRSLTIFKPVSKGWFDRFQKQFHIESVSLHGEAASADKEAMEKSPETFRQIIEEKRYKPEQVFNMDKACSGRRCCPELTL